MAKKIEVLGVASARYDELRAMLDEQSRKVLLEVQGRLRGVRQGGQDSRLRGTGEPNETAALDIQEDIEFALLQQKSEVLNKVNEALARLEQDRYGYCCECGDEIHHARLKALPFAVRCKDCEEKRERASAKDKSASRRGPSSFFEFYQRRPRGK